MDQRDWTPEIPIPLENVGGLYRLGPDLRPRLWWQEDTDGGSWALRLHSVRDGEVHHTFRNSWGLGVGPSLADGAAWAESAIMSHPVISQL